MIAFIVFILIKDVFWKSSKAAYSSPALVTLSLV